MHNGIADPSGERREIDDGMSERSARRHFLKNIANRPDLTDRQRKVLVETVKYRGDPHSLGKVAVRLGLSTVHVRRLLRDASKKLGLSGARDFIRALRRRRSPSARQKMNNTTDSELVEFSYRTDSHYDSLERQRKRLHSDVEALRQKIKCYGTSHPQMTVAERELFDSLMAKFEAESEALKRVTEKARAAWKRDREYHKEWERRQTRKGVEAFQKWRQEAEERARLGPDRSGSPNDCVMFNLVSQHWCGRTYAEIGAQIEKSPAATKKLITRWLAGRKTRVAKVSQ